MNKARFGGLTLALLLALRPALWAARAADAEPPVAPAGAVLIVDRSDDANVMTCGVADGDCTLRGAINKIHLMGIGQEIQFAPAITQVNLTSALPALTATGTAIVGAAGAPIINGAGLASGPILDIRANEVSVAGLTFVNGPAQSILVTSGARSIIGGNTIGLYKNALSCKGNPVVRFSQTGIEVLSSGTSSSNPSAWIHGNVIGCHTGDGIRIIGGDYAMVGVNAAGFADGNWVGTNASAADLPNGEGIRLDVAAGNGASRNQIRNNTIANSALSGIILRGNGSQDTTSTSLNIVAGNTIRDNSQGDNYGGLVLSFGAFWNTIGGAGDGDGNLIHGNGGPGIQISNSDFNGILGNQIGATQIGMTNNTGNGIWMSTSDGNWIGGIFVVLTAFERGNVIGGNSQDGIQLVNGTANTTITGNWIGTDGAGAARPNGLDGITILGGSYSNTVGGDTLVRLNVIAGNGSHGVLIDGSTTSSNTIKLNDIGLNSALLAAQAQNPEDRRGAAPAQPKAIALPNGGHGILIRNGAFGNRVLGGNYIANNVSSGIRLQSGAHDNVIGPGDRIYANGLAGISLADSATQWNRVMTETIYANKRDGIEQGVGPTNNAWVATPLYGNGGLGIDVDAPDGLGNIPSAGYPVITSVVRSGGNVTLTGTSDATVSSFPPNTTRIYVFHSGLDPSGYGEGQTFVREATTDANGIWRVTFAEGATPRCYSAYKRSFGFVLFSYDYGSEFSPSTCVPKFAHLPRVLR